MGDMNFFNRIQELNEYRPIIKYQDGSVILIIKFNKNWRILKPIDDKIAYAPDDKKEGVHWYVSNIVDSDKLFDLIEETIVINKEMEKKMSLYKTMVNQLQELFLSDITYDKLLTLRFTYDDESKRKKKKKNSQKEEIVETVENNKNEIVENSETNETNESNNDIDKKLAEVL
jgi:hypothetical protein